MLLRPFLWDKPGKRTGGGFMSMRQVNPLKFSYEGSPELDFEDVWFCIDTDWNLGFTGR